VLRRIGELDGLAKREYAIPQTQVASYVEIKVAAGALPSSGAPTRAQVVIDELGRGISTGDGP
jgi:hypothetical protein